jgi:hypothetical protein
MDVPRYRDPVIEITDVLQAGVVYLAKYIKGSVRDPVLSLELEAQGEKKLVLKVIYVAFERYGDEVQKYLASKDMAPKFLFSFGMIVGGYPDSHIEKSYVMEYLSPPSNDSAGWISLLDFKERFPKVASKYKVDIGKALHKITGALKERNFIHGDFRPNNLFINVTITADDCSIQFQPDSDSFLPYLKVIDFDWAGEAGVVEYPPHRNPDVQWPGDNGKPILADHDELMIKSWLSKWDNEGVESGGRGVEKRHGVDRQGDAVMLVVFA